MNLLTVHSIWTHKLFVHHALSVDHSFLVKLKINLTLCGCSNSPDPRNIAKGVTADVTGTLGKGSMVITLLRFKKMVASLDLVSYRGGVPTLVLQRREGLPMLQLRAASDYMQVKGFNRGM